MKAGTRFLSVALVAASLVASGAVAQTKPESETLLEAIDDQDNNKVIDLVTRRGRAIVNARGYSGATPLTTAMSKRANPFVLYLLQNGAEPDLADRNGETALIIAARMANIEGVNAMLQGGASVDAANRQGETALIVAVQGRQVAIAKRLLEAGANASRTDSASGLSARDYALRDRRSAEILRLIDSIKPKAKIKFIAGPIIQ